MIKNKKRFGRFFIIGILLIMLISPLTMGAISRSNPQYIPPRSSADYLQGQRISLTPMFSSESCKAGQDFVLQISPLGCSPSVVRSDLLEEQNVPVFCQISATKINPLIDVEAIESIRFRGNYPPEVSGVGFHPARASISTSRNTLLNSPILNNVGYAVIVLKKQRNESAMPDFVKGTLTANIKYDIENAFGVGKAVYHLPQIDDDSDWSNKYKQYSFWNGKAYLRAEDIDENGATVAIYEDEFDRISSFRLENGDTSREIYLPGFYCLAGLKLRLEGLENPDKRVKFNVEGDLIEVNRNERFLENKCKISREPVKRGLIEEVVVNCKTDEGSEDLVFTRSPNIEFGTEKGLVKVGIGERIAQGSGGKSIYLGHIEKNKDGNLGVAVKVKESSEDKLREAEVTSVYVSSKAIVDKWKEGKDFTDKDRSAIATLEGKGIYFLGVEEDKKTIEGQGITLVGFGSAVNKVYENTDEEAEKSFVFKEHFNNAQKDYRELVTNYANEKENPEVKLDTNTYGYKAYVDAIKLARETEQRQTMVELCNEFLEKYPDSYREVGGICNDVAEISNSEGSFKVISINGFAKGISFEGITEPSRDDYSATIVVDDEVVELGRDELHGIRGSKESVQLVSLTDNSARVKINYEVPANGETELKTVTVNLDGNSVKTYGNHNFILDSVNLKKNARVVVIPSIENTGTEANFSYKIGIEKRAIQLTPEETKDKIEALNKTIQKWSEISKNLGNVVRGMKAACVGVQALLTVKSAFSGWSGEANVRGEVMEGWRAQCEKEIETSEQTIDRCLNGHNDEINTQVKEIAAINKKYAAESQAITDSNIGNVYQGLETTPVINPTTGEKALNEKELENLKVIFSKEGLDKVDISRSEAEQLRVLNEVVKLELNEDVKKQYEAERYIIVKKISQNAEDRAAAIKAENEAKNVGVIGLTVEGDADTSKVVGNYGGGKVSGTNPFDLSAGEAVQGIVHNHRVYYLHLVPTGKKDIYSIGKIYDKDNVKIYDVDLDNKYPDNAKMGVADAIIKKYSQFRKFNAESYRNTYKNPEVRYYETGPAKGYPSIVPVDVARGWYAATRPVGGIGNDNLDSFSSSGQPVHFYLGNVMDNGHEEFFVNLGDDRYMSFEPVSGVIYGNFPGLSESETATKVREALGAIQDAQKQYKKGISGNVRIRGQTIAVGKPAVNLPGTNCQDVMSAEDCALLFNVCDPVICPSSRCNLGGNYYVDNVVQSGIVGSLAMCFPNWIPLGGDVAVPICLTGVKAGVDGLNSVFRNYRDCLQHNLDTGETIGICDEIHSIYLCELMWREAVPLAKFTFTNLIGGLFGQKNKGGGEYLGASGAWNAADNSASFITQHYATESFKAFKLRNTDEAGSAICKNWVSARYPSSVDFFDALIEPDSPDQFHAWFHEIPFTDATVPPTSQYKVFYHIYAGNDIGANYQVYLKTPEGNSVFRTNPRIPVATGYIPRGEAFSETKEFTATTGYQELCVSINAKEECGFKQVSTSFALNYVSGQYAANQAANVNINSESSCISGSPDPLALVTPNVQEGVDELINPDIRQRGIVRVCSTANPGKGTDAKSFTNESRWVPVGNCGEARLTCWLDTESVENAIDIKFLEEQALDPAQQTLNQQFADRQKVIDAKYDEVMKDFEFIGPLTNDEIKRRIGVIDDALDEVILNNQEAKLLMLRARYYGQLAILESGELKKNVPTQPAAEGSGGEGDGGSGESDDVSGGVGSNVVGQDGYPQASSLNGLQIETGKKILKILGDSYSKYDQKVKEDTGVKSFKCLMLVQSLQESSLKHCKDGRLDCGDDLQTISTEALIMAGLTINDRNPAKEFSVGVKQINLIAHSTKLNNQGILVGNFEQNVNYGTRYFVEQYEYCKSNAADNFRSALTAYNSGDNCNANSNYVNNEVLTQIRIQTVQKYFSECSLEDAVSDVNVGSEIDDTTDICEGTVKIECTKDVNVCYWYKTGFGPFSSGGCQKCPSVFYSLPTYSPEECAAVAEGCGFDLNYPSGGKCQFRTEIYKRAPLGVSPIYLKYGVDVRGCGTSDDTCWLWTPYDPKENKWQSVSDVTVNYHRDSDSNKVDYYGKSPAESNLLLLDSLYVVDERRGKVILGGDASVSIYP